MEIKYLMNKVRLMPALLRGFLFGHKINKCGKRILVYKGLECNMAYANICFGENCRLYSHTGKYMLVAMESCLRWQTMCASQTILFAMVIIQLYI